MDSFNPNDPLSVEPKVREAARADDCGLRWIKKDASGVKFHAKRAKLGATPVEDHPEHPDLVLCKIPNRAAEEHYARVKADTEEQSKHADEDYIIQHEELTGRLPPSGKDFPCRTKSPSAKKIFDMKGK